MNQDLASFLAPLRELRWSQACVTGLLAEPPSWGRRYSNVPPEAIPIIALGVDGVHYAVWVDNPRAITQDPPVALVSPSDSYPDKIQWVAPSIRAFAELVRGGDEWLQSGDLAIQRARRPCPARAREGGDRHDERRCRSRGV